jgi:hypothetical protein
MLIETFIYLFPTQEKEMGIDPINFTWEKVPVIFDLNEIAAAYLDADDETSPGIKDSTTVLFKSGRELLIQLPYTKFLDIFKNSKIPNE